MIWYKKLVWKAVSSLLLTDWITNIPQTKQTWHQNTQIIRGKVRNYKSNKSNQQVRKFRDGPWTWIEITWSHPIERRTPVAFQRLSWTRRIMRGKHFPVEIAHGLRFSVESSYLHEKKSLGFQVFSLSAPCWKSITPMVPSLLMEVLRCGVTRNVKTPSSPPMNLFTFAVQRR